VGYVFYIEPGPAPGTNIAYFGPEIKVGVPQPALNVDMDALTNVESLSFSFDPTKGVLPIVFIQNQLTRAPIPIPIPNLNPLQPPLGAAAHADCQPQGAQGHGQDEPDAGHLGRPGRGQEVAGRGERQRQPERAALRPPLKARGLVGVRGAGLAYDGLYYVSSVTSTLKRGEFKQSFELTRNGLVSITPRVPV
jgi:hypothetical protein